MERGKFRDIKNIAVFHSSPTEFSLLLPAAFDGRPSQPFSFPFLRSSDQAEFPFNSSSPPINPTSRFCYIRQENVIGTGNWKGKSSSTYSVFPAQKSASSRCESFSGEWSLKTLLQIVVVSACFMF